ncbi:MAG TPA: sulfite exporter TauE/SafE family protein [Polyangiaceae bacterium]|nr:sulfite exporter TauE/SafE family protein [Polyangiaceae bacterium]
MHIEPGISLGSFFAGIVVGLTGMGGGALMMPLLVLGFGIPEVVAVSSDVIASTVMKPVGAAVHLKHGSVRRDLAKWLMVGSVPAALLSPAILHYFVHDETVARNVMRPAIGATLLIAAFALVAKILLSRNLHRESMPGIPVRVLPTVLIGLFGGLVVGLTSVGSGSLMLVLLMWVYPRMSSSELVGTDLVQAVPLVLAAGAGHLIFGQVDWQLTASIVVGTIPGIYLGARYSAKAKDHVLRPILASVLVALGFKLFGASNLVMAGATLIALAALSAKYLSQRSLLAALADQQESQF